MINNRNISESNPKHYYAESERIASKIGSGELRNIPLAAFHLTNEQFVDKQKKSYTVLKRLIECLNSPAKPKFDPLTSLNALHDSLAPEKHLFFYHPDHLGSSSWITDRTGKSVQHLHYLPFGESFVDQRISSFGSRYTFSAKEKDVETGYGYFGARYYSSDLSIWISVDPMSDKYPTMSPYVYCADNPIKLVDPNGEDWYESEDGTTLSYVYGKTDDIEGYKHLGAELDKEHGDKFNNGGYSTLNLSANLTDKDFVTQMGENGKSIMSCAKAAGAMSMKRGGKATSYANENGKYNNMPSQRGNQTNNLVKQFFVK